MALTISASPTSGSRGDIVTLTTTDMFERPVYTGYDPCTNSVNLIGTATLAANGKIGNAVTTPDCISSLACTNWTTTGSFSVAFWMKRESNDPVYRIPWWVGSSLDSGDANARYQYRSIFFGSTTMYVQICRQGATFGRKEVYLYPFITYPYIQIGDWFHIAVTMSNSATTNLPTIYINGISTAYTTSSNPSFNSYAYGSNAGLYANRIGGQFVPRHSTDWVAYTNGSSVCDYYWYDGVWTNDDVRKLANIPAIVFGKNYVTPTRFPNYTTAIITVP